MKPWHFIRILNIMDPGIECLQMAFGSGINLLQADHLPKQTSAQRRNSSYLLPNSIKGLNLEHLQYENTYFVRIRTCRSK